MEKVVRKNPEETIALHLAQIMQRWSEICRGGVEMEISPELQYYMAGRADAHEMDAARCRTATKVSSQDRPPDDLLRFGRAYEIILGMLQAASPKEATPELVLAVPADISGDGKTETPIPERTVVERLRERASRLTTKSTETQEEP